MGGNEDTRDDVRRSLAMAERQSERIRLKYRNRQGTDIVKVIVLIVIFLTAALIPAGTSAAPTAEIAKRCMHYS